MKVPLGQGEQDEAPPSGAYCVVWQGWQVEAPGEAENVPGSQEKHSDAPAAEEYCPARHLTQVVLPWLRCAWPTGHGVHVVDSLTLLKVPEPHDAQPERPAATEMVPAGQLWHSIGFGASGRNLPCQARKKIR